MTLKVLIADDEPLAQRRLAGFLAELPWVRLVGKAADGPEALAAIRRLHPDVVLLDIRMPGLTGLEVLGQVRALDTAPAVIFTTAYDQHAVTAFELEAVDYLLKPFGQRRFRAALERARRVLAANDSASQLVRAQAALQTSPERALERILVRDRDTIIALTTTEILRAEAQDDYTALHARGRCFLTGVRLQELEERLPNPPFLRVHRSHIVNLDQVERMVPQGDGRYEIRMKDGACIQASRMRSQEIRRQAR